MLYVTITNNCPLLRPHTLITGCHSWWLACVMHATKHWHCGFYVTSVLFVWFVGFMSRKYQYLWLWGCMLHPYASHTLSFKIMSDKWSSEIGRRTFTIIAIYINCYWCLLIKVTLYLCMYLCMDIQKEYVTSVLI